MAKPVARPALNKTVIFAAMAVVVLLAAIGVWRFSGSSFDKEDARYRRAEQACLSSTESDKAGNVKTGVGPEDRGVAASAGVSSRDIQKRGPNERVATADWLKESDAIRACMERQLAADKAAP
jgi:hypothetical protein